MKKIFLLLAIISALLFIYGVYHLLTRITVKDFSISISDIKGFEKIAPNDDANQLIDKFNQQISSGNEEVKSDQAIYFWLSFLVTALTAGSTLISSIQAARKNPPSANDSKVFAIVIAIITFASTLANFASSHFNDLKTDAAKKAADYATTRNKFFTDYDKASDAEKPLVIKQYAGELP